MTTPNRTDPLTCVVVRVQDRQLAIPAACVGQLVHMPAVTALPNAPASMRGVINLRGQVLSLIDLRVHLGLGSLAQEIDQTVGLLTEREQDHRHWIAELEACVKEGREFKLARDPHQCKFGKWYHTYKPQNQTLAFLWRRFDGPHQRIHAIADQVCALAKEGDTEGALAIIDAVRSTELAQMLTVFEEARLALRESTREVAVVLEHQGRRAAIAVDAIEAVERLDSAAVENLPGELLGACGELTPTVARRENNAGLALLLEVPRLLAAVTSRQAA